MSRSSFSLAVVVVACIAGACRAKPPPDTAAPVVAAPPSERKPAPPAPSSPSTATPAPEAQSPAQQAAANTAVLEQYGAKMDPGSVVIRAKSVLDHRIDRFKEDHGRWPRSLAEAGITRVDLPPGKKVQYNAATGEAKIVDQ
jgi:hypothetical protein